MEGQSRHRGDGVLDDKGILIGLLFRREPGPTRSRLARLHQSASTITFEILCEGVSRRHFTMQQTKRRQESPQKLNIRIPLNEKLCREPNKRFLSCYFSWVRPRQNDIRGVFLWLETPEVLLYRRRRHWKLFDCSCLFFVSSTSRDTPVIFSFASV